MPTRKQTSQKISEQLAAQPVRHLLVDLDGTLLGNRSLALSVDFLRRSFTELKKYGSPGKIAKALMAVQREFSKPSSERPNDERVTELFAKQMELSLEKSRSILREGVLLIFPDLRRHFYPIDGAKDFLDWAKDRYSLTLATNPVWPPEILELRVQWAGIDPTIFGSMTHIRRMHACKPAARYYEDILRQQHFRAEDCLLIGDNLKMDLPATRVGIRVYIISQKTRLGTLRHTRGKAPAWRGSYVELRRLLQESA